MSIDFFQPYCEVAEWLAWCETEANYDGIRVFIEQACYRSELLLARCVPQLEFDMRLVLQHHLELGADNTNCLRMVTRVLISFQSMKESRLPDSRVSHHDHFVKGVMSDCQSLIASVALNHPAWQRINPCFQFCVHRIAISANPIYHTFYNTY